MARFLPFLAAWLAALWLAPPALATIVSVTDDAGHTVTLARPAGRIVSLAPHITELLFAAGAGKRVVGAVQYSNYPPAARKLPRVGGYTALDLERIVALKPDLVVAWGSGNPPYQMEKLRGFGIPVFVSEPKTLEDIPRSLERLGALAGSGAFADRAAAQFRDRLAALRARYAGRRPVPTFYEVWNQPLMTVGGGHLISQVIELCGGKNVFDDLSAPAAPVDEEAVLSRNPEAIVASGMGSERPEWLDAWKRWPGVTAVSRNNLFFVPPDLIQRQGPRILQGAERLCRQLDEARNR